MFMNVHDPGSLVKKQRQAEVGLGLKGRPALGEILEFVLSMTECIPLFTHSLGGRKQKPIRLICQKAEFWDRRETAYLLGRPRGKKPPKEQASNAECKLSYIPWQTPKQNRHGGTTRGPG